MVDPDAIPRGSEQFGSTVTWNRPNVEVYAWYPKPTQRRAPSRLPSLIVYGLIALTTIFSFWDLFLLGTHSHG
jgi:hypothetical protein